MKILLARLLIIKWRENKYPNDFIEYFEKFWLKPNKIGWLDHYVDWAPCQNNALESVNRYVKDTGTYRERLGVVEFLHVLEFGFVKKWSTERNPLITRMFNKKNMFTSTQKLRL